LILHITSRGEWEEALRRGTHSPPSLAAEGFIHCSTITQALSSASRHFRGRSDLVLLCIEERLLTSPLKYEPPASTHDDRIDSLFPHIHGSLNVEAVTKVVDFPCQTDGRFQLPAALADESEV
jgi:uncharacterized protein (DUF952 family)